MCGGNLEILPCSHVGHVFRGSSPYKWGKAAAGETIRRNSIRLAEVWMDEYAAFYYARTGNVKGDFGDISQRVQLRKDLGCKSFKWYLDNIYPELGDPLKSISYGEVCLYIFCNDCEVRLMVSYLLLDKKSRFRKKHVLRRCCRQSTTIDCLLLSWKRF